jgi:Flp pilus assembly protein TadG
MPAQGLAEFAVISVALLVVVIGISNLAFWLYAQQVVTAAAQEAAVVASREDGTVADGREAGQSMLRAGLGATAVTEVADVAVWLDSEVARAEVRGRWPMTVGGPLLYVPLKATASLARDRFRPGGR